MKPQTSLQLPRVLFATSNEIKLEEAKQILPSIRPRPMEFQEIQSQDTREVVTNKLWQIRGQEPSEAYMVEDTGLSFLSWNMLPGAMIKWFIEGLGTTGLADLVRGQGADNRAVATSAVGVRFQGVMKVWSGTLDGTIVSPRGQLGGWTSIFEVAGIGKTLAEMSAAERLAVTMRREPMEQAISWLGIRNMASVPTGPRQLEPAE